MAPIVLAGFTAFLSLYAPQPLLPLFERIFGASHFASSLTITATTTAVALSAPLAGRLADLWGRRRVIVTSAFLLAAATLGAATARSLHEVIVWRFAQGLVTPGVFAVAVAYIHDRFEAARTGTITGAYVSGTVMGGFVGRLVSGHAAEAWGWRASFEAIGGLSLVCAVLLALRLPAEQRHVSRAIGSEKAGRHSLASALARLTTRQMTGTYAAGFCVLFTQIAVFTYVTFYLAAPPFNLTTAALGWLFAVYLVGAVVTPLSGRLIDARGHRVALALAMTIGAAGSVLTLGHALASVVAGLALVCSGVFIAQAAANSYIGVAATDDRGLAVGLYATCYYVGGSVGGVVPSFFWATGGWSACVALVAAVQVATAAIGVSCWKSGPQLGAS